MTTSDKKNLKAKLKANKVSKVSIVQEVPIKSSLLPAQQGTTPDALLSQAIEKGMDLAQLQQLIEMVNKWQERQARKEYFEAFSKFQSIAPDLTKNKQVSFPHKMGEGSTDYKFQELGDIAKHIRGALAECGLGYRWEQVEKGNEVSVTCIITHRGGHEERGQPLSGQHDTSGKKTGIQAKASTISYLRRYTLTGMLGLSSSDGDNDGQGGVTARPFIDDFTDFTDLRPIDPSQMNNVLKKVQSGEWDMAYIDSHFSATPDQYSALQKMAELFKSKK